MRLDGVVVVILMLLPLLFDIGFNAYIYWITVTLAYVIYVANLMGRWENE